MLYPNYLDRQYILSTLFYINHLNQITLKIRNIEEFETVDPTHFLTMCF